MISDEGWSSTLFLYKVRERERESKEGLTLKAAPALCCVAFCSVTNRRRSEKQNENLLYYLEESSGNVYRVQVELYFVSKFEFEFQF